MSNERMSQPFNLTTEYETEVEPHLRAAWEACKRHDIPCILAVCHSNEPSEEGTRMGMVKGVHLIGKERTPAAFVMADVAIDESVHLAALAVIAGKIESEGEPDDSPEEKVSVEM